MRLMRLSETRFGRRRLRQINHPKQVREADRPCVETDPSHGRGGQEWCAAHGQLLSRCRIEEAARGRCYPPGDLEAARAAIRASGAVPITDERLDDLEAARKLIGDALHIRWLEGRPWSGWDARAEAWLRGRTPPPKPGLTPQERADIDACDEDD